MNVEQKGNKTIYFLNHILFLYYLIFEHAQLKLGFIVFNVFKPEAFS